MKSKDPDCRIPVSRDEFRCFKCDYPSPKDKGGWKEIESGLRAMVCDDCYKPKKAKRWWSREQLREAGSSISSLLQILYELHLISDEAVRHGNMCETDLLNFDEDL